MAAYSYTSVGGRSQRVVVGSDAELAGVATMMIRQMREQGGFIMAAARDTTDPVDEELGEEEPASQLFWVPASTPLIFEFDNEDSAAAVHAGL